MQDLASNPGMGKFWTVGKGKFRAWLGQDPGLNPKPGSHFYRPYSQILQLQPPSHLGATVASSKEEHPFVNFLARESKCRSPHSKYPNVQIRSDVTSWSQRITSRVSVRATPRFTHINDSTIEICHLQEYIAMPQGPEMMTRIRRMQSECT